MKHRQHYTTGQVGPQNSLQRYSHPITLAIYFSFQFLESKVRISMQKATEMKNKVLKRYLRTGAYTSTLKN